MDDDNLTEGQVIAEVLEMFYGDGTVFEHKNTRGLLPNVNMQKYNLCRKNLESGDYGQDDINLAWDLLRIGAGERCFHAEAGVRVEKYCRKILEESE